MALAYAFKDEQCRNCRFWVRNLDDVKGWCHRYPPLMPRQTDEEEDWGEWPSTGEPDWCGEWSQAE